MPLQDLTPQLRTRLNRMERAVGWFIMIATLLLILGFGYYIYQTAEKKGWFAEKVRYYTYAQSGSGLEVRGDVTLMGFVVGHITDILPMPARGPGSEHNVYVEFEVVNQKVENSGYIWSKGSVVKFVDSGFLGVRKLDLTRGSDDGYGTYIHYPVKLLSLEEARTEAQSKNLRIAEELHDGTNMVRRAWSGVKTNLELAVSLGKTNLWVMDTTVPQKHLVSIWNDEGHHYEPVTKKSKYGLPPEEPQALGDRLQGIVGQVQAALPGVFLLTNQLATVLANATRITSNLSDITESLKPSVTNLAVITEAAKPTITNLGVITGNLKDPNGSLGQWVIPTNINQKLETTLDSANGAVTSLNTNLVTLNRTLDNVGNITSNLNVQVQANTNLVSNISQIIVHADDFIQGLKRFWLFRHTFAAPKPAKAPKKDKTAATKNSSAPSDPRNGPLLSPRESGESRQPYSVQ